MTALLRALVDADRASVPDLLAAQANRRGERPFLTWDGRAWTYAEALREAEAMAAALAALGAVGPERRVASFLGNRPEAYWAWFGTQLSGAVYVALNRGHRGEILADMLRRSCAEALVTERSALAELPDPATVGIPRYLVIDEVPDARDPSLVPYQPGASEAAPRAAPKPSDLASILFTSGTTGRAKAVMISHNHLCRGGARFAESIALREEDRWHAWMPMYHIFGQLHVTMATLAAGASVALYPTFSRSRFWQQVDESGATIIGGLGNVVRMLWDAPDRDQHADNPLRTALIASPPPELRTAFAEHFGVTLVDSYGMTEAEPVTVPVPGEELPAGSQGVANPDFEVAILDRDGNRIGSNERGEIAIRPLAPDVMFRGYEGDEAATVAAWKDLWFHTGDWGRIDERGYLYLMDRRKYVIRNGGENVSPSEVEAILARHPTVADCAVVGVPAALGDEDVKATVVPVAGAELDPAELHRFCGERMARFMVPRLIETVSELPYSELGKVDREALKRTSGELWDARAEPTGIGAEA